MASGFDSGRVLNTGMYQDAAIWLDPAVFALGVLFVATALSLSQTIRENPNILLRNQGGSLLFWLARKVLSFQFIAGLVLGFWIVGWWWIVILGVIWACSAVLTNIAQLFIWQRGVTYFLGLIGLFLTSWGQSPLLKNWGVMP